MEGILIASIVTGAAAYMLGQYKGSRHGFRRGFVCGWQALRCNCPQSAPNDVVMHVASRSDSRREGEVWEWLRDSGVFVVLVGERGRLHVKRNWGLNRRTSSNPEDSSSSHENGTLRTNNDNSSNPNEQKGRA